MAAPASCPNDSYHCWLEGSRSKSADWGLATIAWATTYAQSWALDRLASAPATWDSRLLIRDMPNVHSCPRQPLAITYKLGEESLRFTGGFLGNGCIHPRDWVGHLNRDERWRRRSPWHILNTCMKFEQLDKKLPRITTFHCDLHTNGQCHWE